MLATDLVGALQRTPCWALLRDAMAATGEARLVGGAVRDVLLERAPRELDVVVAGDPEALVTVLGGTAVRHGRFGTAKVTREGCTYDIARARRETYAHPGALPDVAPAGLEEDLRRRDLTINAIAMAPDGALTAVDGALEDLASGTLRVLHDASFRDDPTRLWRMARYAARLGFAPDAHTAALAQDAVAAGALGTVSGERIGAEVRLALGEPDPGAALRAAAGLGLLPAFAAAPAGDLLRVARELLPADGRVGLLVLAAWTRAAPPAELRAWLEDLGFPATDRDRVLAAAGAPERLGFAGAPSAVARALANEPSEAVALAGAAHDPDAARCWLAEGRHVRLAITGEDLLAAGVAPGPDVGARLARALDAKRDGRAATREDELAVALEPLP